jgi:hypothetical protein
MRAAKFSDAQLRNMPHSGSDAPLPRSASTEWSLDRTRTDTRLPQVFFSKQRLSTYQTS